MKCVLDKLPRSILEPMMSRYELNNTAALALTLLDCDVSSSAARRSLAFSDAPSAPGGVRNLYSTVTPVRTRSVTVTDAPLIHDLYGGTPGYFDIISIPLPTVEEVATDLATAIADPRRYVEIVLIDEEHRPATPHPEAGPCQRDPISGNYVVGYLDYKLDYPELGDATVNLLLIRPGLQSHGLGSACALDLEQRLAGRSKRLLASIYGENPRARRFWEGLGYHFAIDAKPLIEWYAKQLA